MRRGCSDHLLGLAIRPRAIKPMYVYLYAERYAYEDNFPCAPSSTPMRGVLIDAFAAETPTIQSLLVELLFGRNTLNASEHLIKSLFSVCNAKSYHPRRVFSPRYSKHLDRAANWAR